MKCAYKVWNIIWYKKGIHHQPVCHIIHDKYQNIMIYNSYSFTGNIHCCAAVWVMSFLLDQIYLPGAEKQINISSPFVFILFQDTRSFYRPCCSTEYLSLTEIGECSIETLHKDLILHEGVSLLCSLLLHVTNNYMSC